VKDAGTHLHAQKREREREEREDLFCISQLRKQLGNLQNGEKASFTSKFVKKLTRFVQDLRDVKAHSIKPFG